VDIGESEVRELISSILGPGQGSVQKQLQNAHFYGFGGIAGDIGKSGPRD